MVETLNVPDTFGKVFRHKRLFNYVISPVSSENGSVTCMAGSNMQQAIPMDYFKRDWKEDPSISLEELIAKMEKYPESTPFTMAYNDYFEVDDNQPHTYLHFDDFDEENAIRFPAWKLTECKKSERDELINPFTMIMPVRDDVVVEVSKEIELMNEIRKDNEFIEFDDFQGFEFGLLKILEKKYLREI